MTVVEDSLPPGFWDNAEFPDAEVRTEAPPELPPDDTTWINPPQNACPVCGEEVVKEEGQRRRPKYHAECKPVRGKAGGTAARPVRVVAKQREAAEQVEMVLDRLRGGLQKAVMFLALADPYDALVLHVNSDDIVENCRPILMRFPALRESGANANAFAAVVGLIVTGLSTLLPILAHHNLFPIKKFVPLLLNLPMTMLQIQEMASGNGGDITQTLLATAAQQKRAQQEAAMRAATVEATDGGLIS